MSLCAISVKYFRNCKETLNERIELSEILCGFSFVSGTVLSVIYFGVSDITIKQETFLIVIGGSLESS